MYFNSFGSCHSKAGQVATSVTSKVWMVLHIYRSPSIPKWPVSEIKHETANFVSHLSTHVVRLLDKPILKTRGFLARVFWTTYDFQYF